MKAWPGIFVFLFVLGSIPAQAQEGRTYIGLQLSQMTYSDDTTSNDSSPLMLTAKVGYRLHRHLALEGRIGTGISSDKAKAEEMAVIAGNTVLFKDDSTYDIEIDHLMGVYMKGIFGLTQRVSAFGILGFAQAKVSKSNPSLSMGTSNDLNSNYSSVYSPVYGSEDQAKETSSTSGISWGGGIDIHLSEAFHLGIEYMNDLNTSSFELQSLSAFLAFNF